ncbi:MAG: nuclear transport factor 2 family protein [Sphingomonadales bacterium]|nr:nuclear transport factor 2 family protein [Sphingomonadales bacterium]
MDSEQRLAALEARLQRAEDHLAILNLINSYGPMVDSGMSHEAAALWTVGGGYNYSGGNSNGTRLEAPEGLVAVYEGAGHHSLFTTGSAHLMATPKITVDGDRAHAVGYSFVILREGERWSVFRAAINDYELVRTAEGWRIAERVNRTLTGSAESHALMRKVLD